MGICNSCGGLGNRSIQRMAYASHGSYLMMAYDSCQNCRGSGRTPDYRHKGARQSDGLRAALSIMISIFVCFKLSHMEFYLDVDLGWKLVIQVILFICTMVMSGTFLAIPIIRKAINLIFLLFASVAILSFFFS